MSDIASANEAYGQLKANLFIAGFTLERAFHGFLEPLLKDSQWKLCGPGYDDVNKFMNSLRLDKFRVIAEDRKAIVQRIKQLQPKVSNRQIARTLGVSDQTVNNDAKNLAAARDKSGGAATGSAKNLAPALTGGEAARTVEQREQSAKADPSARRATPERRAGQLLTEMPKVTGGEVGGRQKIDGNRARSSNPKQTLAALGISGPQSASPANRPPAPP